MVQWVGHVNIAHFIFLSSALLVRILYATFIIVTIEKTIVFIFIKFSPFAISFLYFNKQNRTKQNRTDCLFDTNRTMARLNSSVMVLDHLDNR